MAIPKLSKRLLSARERQHETELSPFHFLPPTNKPTFAQIDWCMSLSLGVFNKLNVVRITEAGAFLSDGGDQEAFLPQREVPKGTKPGDEFPVFLFKDSEDLIIATTRKPRLTLGQYAGLRAKASNRVGAFFEWGPSKELIVPGKLQENEIIEGQRYVVYLFLDEETNRLCGTTKINSTFSREKVELEVGEEVHILPYKLTDLGYKVVVNHQYPGMLYQNEVFTEIELGRRYTAYIKNVRDDDKVDVSLNKVGYAAVEMHVERVRDALQASNGFLRLNDKSDPAAITARLGMSKKLFKKAIGALYKEKAITIEEDGIKLVNAPLRPMRLRPGKDHPSE